MELLDSVRTVFTKYATFAGTARRQEFWWFVLFTAIAHLALNSLNIFTAHGTVYLGASLSGMFGVIAFVPTLAVTVRRLRDAGRRWTSLFWVLLPVVGLIILIVRLAGRSEQESDLTLIPSPVVPAHA
jgi:uncharacterized membrane protein YhaH (DUF805 family)